MTSSGNLNMVSQIIAADYATDKAKLNAAVIDFAKTKNDKAGRAAIRSYKKYWVLSLLLWIGLTIILFLGLFLIGKRYDKLNDPGDLKYKSVVTGYVNEKTGMIDYYVGGYEYEHFPISKATWISSLNLKDDAGVNVFLDDNFDPIYMSKYYNKYFVIFPFVISLVILLIVGIVLINRLSVKKFSDYTNWFIYTVLPISDDPNYETLIKKLEYRKLDFSTKNLNTKEARELRKANKIQIICGIILLVILPISFSTISVMLGYYANHGLSFGQYLIVIVIALPFVIMGVNADHKARGLKQKVASQNYERIFNEGKNNK